MKCLTYQTPQNNANATKGATKNSEQTNVNKTEVLPMDEIKLNVFITDLKAYDNGGLIGKWFDARTELPEIIEYAEKLGHWFITDHESDLFYINENTSIEEIDELTDLLTDFHYSEDVAQSVKEWTYYNEDIENIIGDDAIIIVDSSDGILNENEALGLREYEAVIEPNIVGGQVEDITLRYFDTESFGRDLILNGDYSYIGKDENSDHIFIMNY